MESATAAGGDKNKQDEAKPTTTPTKKEENHVAAPSEQQSSSSSTSSSDTKAQSKAESKPKKEGSEGDSKAAEPPADSDQGSTSAEHGQKGSTVKAWKVKSDAPPPKERRGSRDRSSSPREGQAHGQGGQGHQGGQSGRRGSRGPQVEVQGHRLQTAWTFWFSRKEKKRSTSFNQANSNASPASARANNSHSASPSTSSINSHPPSASSSTAQATSTPSATGAPSTPATASTTASPATSSSATSPSSASGQHIDAKALVSPNASAEDRDHREKLVKLGTCHSIEEFWNLYCYLQRPSGLPKESNYYVFRDQALPMWETFPKGGCFIVRVKKQSEVLCKMWEELLFAALGEAFEEPNVVGVVVSIRSKEDALSVWTKNNQKQLRTKVGDKLRELLDLDKNAVVMYKNNATSMRDHSTYKNAQKVLVAS